MYSHDSDQLTDSFEDEDEQYSSDDEEQEDPQDYCKGMWRRRECSVGM